MHLSRQKVLSIEIICALFCTLFILRNVNTFDLQKYPLTLNINFEPLQFLESTNPQKIFQWTLLLFITFQLRHVHDVRWITLPFENTERVKGRNIKQTLTLNQYNSKKVLTTKTIFQ